MQTPEAGADLQQLLSAANVMGTALPYSHPTFLRAPATVYSV